MRAAALFAICLALAIAEMAKAGAPLTSLRPKPRDQVVTFATSAQPTIRVSDPDNEAQLILEATLRKAGETTLASTRPVYRSPRPAARPEGLGAALKTTASGRQPRTTATGAQARTSATGATTKTKSRVASTEPPATTGAGRGGLCGDPRIRGEKLKPIRAKTAGCGIAEPVRVSEVDGVTLSQQSIMDCDTARTLRAWVSDSLKPALKFRGGGVTSLKVAAHYSCRTRNSQKGAKISEHGKGHAIDIAAFTLADGSSLTVKEGWNKRSDRKILERLHASACGPFGTVLGPESDRFHKDHFHLDTARHRGGSYCR